MLFHHSISYVKKIHLILIFTANDHYKPNKILNFDLLKTKIHYQNNSLFIFY